MLYVIKMKQAVRQPFSIQESIVYTSTTLSGNGKPKTEVFQSGYAETTDDSITKYYVLATDGEFTECSKAEYETVKKTQDTMKPIQKTGLSLPKTSPALLIHNDTEVGKLRRENRELRQLFHKN